jgi:methyl-accepting chemotaxis protein
VADTSERSTRATRAFDVRRVRCAFDADALRRRLESRTSDEVTTTTASWLLEGSTDAICARLAAEMPAKLGGTQPVLVAVFASTQQDLGAITGSLASSGAVVVGCTTAGEFVEHGDAKNAVAVFALGGEGYRASAGLGDGLAADPEGAIARALEGQPREVNGFAHRTAIALLDPLAGNGEEVALMLSAELGPDVPIAGGAAGDDLAMKATRVAHGARSSGDALVVAQIFSKQPLAIGIRHGHRPMSGPLRVTRAEGGVVYEVEGRPAWEVWKEQTRERAAAVGVDVDTIGVANAGAFLLQYEAGLANGDGYKVRAPLALRDDGGILFAAAIPQGAVIRITESDSSAQVDSAIAAARHARQTLDGVECAGALVFDCICRNLILGREFGRAVRGISRALGDVPIAGFETYGEVGLRAGSMSGFHNTTSVVLAFPRG